MTKQQRPSKKPLKSDKYADQVLPRNRKGERTGYTTGSNASAAAKAATIALFTRQWPDTVSITLPIGETATMTPVEQVLTENSAYCCMVKDAGDDPDVTHGTLICAEVKSIDEPGIRLEGGEGVGTVTLPGLGLMVGGPAINPVPREQIQQNVGDALVHYHEEGLDYLERAGVEVTISVPDGVTLAEKTLNGRLGIIGGISILGTTGKVFPYSTAAWRASVIQAVEVAAQNDTKKVVLATGGRSEKFAMKFFPDLPEVAFVELSVFTGDALKTCAGHGVQTAIFVGMMGKMIKTAQGHMNTHVAGNQVDFSFLSQVCQDVNAPAELTKAVKQANTGRHFLELCQEYSFMQPVQKVTELALAECLKFIQENQGHMNLEVILVDFNGDILAQATHTVSIDTTMSHKGTISAPLIERLSADPTKSYDDEKIMGGFKGKQVTQNKKKGGS
ncbi:MAG: cobalt-precorrin-5B (C(1))-methyltransferase [Chloroflexota bacterium]